MKMKLLHTSDIHLDSPLTSRLSPSEARERKRELTASLRRMVDEARDVGACAVIIAGDLFDNERVSLKTLDYIMGIIESAPSVCFLYLPGNHEKDRLLTSGVRIPENLKVFGEDWTYYKLGNITVAGRTSITRDMFSALNLNDGDTNIVTLHGVLAERTDDEERIGIKDVEGLPIDYLALGHYHKYSETKIKDRGVAVYSGTPEGRGFDETGEKGYVLIETDNSGLRHKFLPRATRRLHIVAVDISGADREIEIENRVAHRIAAIPREDLVRVALTGEHEPGIKRDTESLTARFKSSFFYFEARDESRLRISADDYKNDKSFKGEFIRLVLSKDGLSDERKAAIIECGIRALSKET